MIYHVLFDYPEGETWAINDIISSLSARTILSDLGYNSMVTLFSKIGLYLLSSKTEINA